MGPIESAATKVAMAAGISVIVLIRTRNVPRPELGFARPPIGLSALLLIVYLGWMLASDAAIHWRGPWDFRPWLQAPLAASAMRVLAVGILGPIAEELVFRGWFFGLLDKRIGPALTIAATAVGWALLHYSYTAVVIGVIMVDGLLLGLARWRTKSVFPPMLMHALYNLYAIW